MQMMRNVWDTVKIIVQALLIALILRTCLFQSYNIPSGSMVPTLLVNDFLFVSKYSYGYSKYSLPFNLPLFSGRILGSEPKRGDVIVFKLPKDDSQDYIKRLVGMPGDKIQMKEGRLYINDTVVPRERIEDFFYKGRRIPQYIETLPNGVKHHIIEYNDDNGPLDNTELYTVPEGHYFMMGDNRDDSLDSRVSTEVGYVPYINLVGRAEVIFLSVDETASAWQFWQWPWTIRGERMFQPIR
ncbi:signal peptidase I [Microvirga sp. W0021]|uniref:Signal peptidase I n=1 Tax=Hohaiivirga grylli TaxID=3133970 RepID=A0ABV0BI28_9HYPH